MRWITVVILALRLGMAEGVAAQIGTAREIFGDLLAYLVSALALSCWVRFQGKSSSPAMALHHRKLEPHPWYWSSQNLDRIESGRSFGNLACLLRYESPALRGVYGDCKLHSRISW